MDVKISEQVWAAAGKDNGDVNGTLDWILGYLSTSNPNVALMGSIRETEPPTVTVSIDDQTAQQIKLRFGRCEDGLISTLLAVAYALGGQE